jgi:hypothetical protein
MRIRRSLLLASLLGLGFVSACTTTSEGEPLPADSTENTTSSSAPQTSGEEELPFAGAPKVANPLDTSRYEQDSCQSLTADQAQSLDLPPAGTIIKVPLSKACEWKNPTTRGYVKIAFIVDDPRGLSPEYDANNRRKYAYFDALPNIEGFPAVARDIVDDRDKGYCSVVVGVADDMVFDTSVQLSQVNVGIDDPCKTAVDVAELALQTMKQEG